MRLRTTCETEMWNDALERIRERAREVIGRAVEDSRPLPDGTHEVMVEIEQTCPLRLPPGTTIDNLHIAPGIDWYGCAGASPYVELAEPEDTNRTAAEYACRPSPCPDCRGTGEYRGLASVEPCRTCGGRGAT